MCAVVVGASSSIVEWLTPLSSPLVTISQNCRKTGTFRSEVACSAGLKVVNSLCRLLWPTVTKREESEFSGFSTFLISVVIISVDVIVVIIVVVIVVVVVVALWVAGPGDPRAHAPNPPVDTPASQSSVG